MNECYSGLGLGWGYLVRKRLLQLLLPCFVAGGDLVLSPTLVVPVCLGTVECLLAMSSLVCGGGVGFERFVVGESEGDEWVERLGLCAGGPTSSLGIPLSLGGLWCSGISS